MSFSEWKTYKLGDLVTFQRGHDLAKSEFIEGEFPIAGSNGIIGYHNKFTTKAPSLTVGRSGNLGTPHFYKENFWAHNTTLYVKEFHKSDPRFIYYLLQTLDLKQFNSGSAVPSLNRNYIHPIEVIAPDIKTQQRIASILSSLDDAIELNQQINKTLEEMAKAIFKEWFVDFNFPNATSKFQETEIGKIPVGWKVYSFGDLVETVSETYRFGKKEKIIFLNTGDILEGEFLHRNYSEIASLPGQAKKSIKKNDILFSEIRPANKRFAFVNFDADEYVVSTKLMVLRSKGINSLLVYFLLTREEMLKQLQHLAESRSGTFPQITFTQLKDLKVALPTGETLDKFIKYLEAYYSQSKQNIEENQSLMNLRDTLLPKLMKGEIEIICKADVAKV